MRNLIHSIALGCMIVSCSSTQKVTYDPNPSRNLQHILDDETANSKEDVVGISLTVISPDLQIDFSGAAGYDSVKKDRLLDVNQPFRIASLTKVFVAVAILRLREEGLLSIEDPISKYISEKHIDILRGGGYDPDQITIRHCLNHTSGLYDYAEGGPEYTQEASKEPGKRWSRTEQIQFAMKYGSPHAAPGIEENYSDTGYVLLGEIIEQLTQTGLAQGLRELLKFDELGMSSTYLESLENRPDGLLPSVRRYFNDVDASDWDNSVDLFGGGGLVSTTRDLSIFLQALFNDRIFEKEDTLAVMLLKKEFKHSGTSLPTTRLGFGSIIGKKSGVEAYVHTGFWGTLFMHFPKYNCSIALNNTTDEDSNALQRVINYVQWLAENKNN